MYMDNKIRFTIYSQTSDMRYVYTQYYYYYTHVGGVFQVKLSFDENFNTHPPEVHFMTIPFHPNGG